MADVSAMDYSKISCHPARDTFALAAETSGNSFSTSSPLQTHVSPVLDAVQVRTVANLLFSVHWDAEWSGRLKDLGKGGDSMMHLVFGHLGEPNSPRSSKAHLYDTRMGLMSVLLRLDRHYSGVIRSPKLTDEGGVAILLVIERMQRECCAFARHFCGCHRGSRMLQQLLWWIGSTDPKPEHKSNNLKRQGFVLGGGRALEPCKSL